MSRFPSAFAASRYAVEGPRAASSVTVSDAILLIFVSRLQAVAGPGAVVSDTIASLPSTAA